ncbi:MAG: GNAT family N-acetyltransferase [Pseudomonadota bacterium]
MVIRTANADDLPDIDALLSASYPALLKHDYAPSILVTAIPLISRAQPNLIASGTYFVAQAEDTALVAAGGWTRGAPPGSQSQAQVGHIRHVVTDHRRTRQGVGRRLMQAVIADARAAGMTRLECMSTLTAEAFYQACGFRTLRDITVPLREGIAFPAKAMTMEIG